MGSNSHDVYINRLGKIHIRWGRYISNEGRLYQMRELRYISDEEDIWYISDEGRYTSNEGRLYQMREDIYQMREDIYIK